MVLGVRTFIKGKTTATSSVKWGSIFFNASLEISESESKQTKYSPVARLSAVLSTAPFPAFF